MKTESGVLDRGAPVIREKKTEDAVIDRLNVVVEDVLGAPAVGVKASASSSLVIADALPDSV